MKNVSLLLILIIVVTGIVSPAYGLYGHALADEIAYKAGCIRGDGPLTNVAVNVIEATKRSPFILPSRVVQSDNKQIICLAKRLTKGKKTDVEKSRAIYDWMTHHITYDYNEFLNYKCENFNYKDALETLKEGDGICMEYSRLDAALHRALGIEAKIVYGEGHAWDQVKLNGEWVDQDCTYGSGYIDEFSHEFIQQYNPKYFSRTDKRWEGEFEW